MLAVRLPMKPGDRIIWIRSPGRSFLTGWRVQLIPAVVVSVCMRRLRIRVRLAGTEKIVIVNPENVISAEEAGEGMLRSDAGAG